MVLALYQAYAGLMKKRWTVSCFSIPWKTFCELGVFCHKCLGELIDQLV